jgi:hypothetical protein
MLTEVRPETPPRHLSNLVCLEVELKLRTYLSHFHGVLKYRDSNTSCFGNVQTKDCACNDKHQCVLVSQMLKTFLKALPQYRQSGALGHNCVWRVKPSDLVLQHPAQMILLNNTQIVGPPCVTQSGGNSICSESAESVRIRSHRDRCCQRRILLQGSLYHLVILVLTKNSCGRLLLCP